LIAKNIVVVRAFLEVGYKTVKKAMKRAKKTPEPTTNLRGLGLREW
jgi:hypothetical protein